MRIVVNDIAASSGGALSILNSFYEFIKHDKEARNHEWIFLLSDKYIEEYEHIQIVILKSKKKWLRKIFFDYISGRHYINSINPDIVLSLQNTVTYGIKCPQIIYMHQSLPFQTIKKFSFLKSSERKFAIYQYLIGMIIKASINSSSHVIVQTNWIKQSIIKSCNKTEEDITVIIPSVMDFEKPSNIMFSNNKFFYPASSSIYKNHKVLEEAVEILNKKGYKDYVVTITADIKSDTPQIIDLGELSFREVIENYASSTLVFPSYIETIGLPLIEARKIGTLVLASDTPFSREALNEYDNGYFFNPFIAEELADLMEKVICGEISRASNSKPTTEMIGTWDEIICIIMKGATG